MHWLEDENLERIACVTPLKRHRPPWSIAIPFTKSSSTRAMVACFLAPHTEPLWHGIAKGVFELVDLNQVALVVVIMYSLHHDTDMLDVVSKKSNTSNRSLWCNATALCFMAFLVVVAIQEVTIFIQPECLIDRIPSYLAIVSSYSGTFALCIQARESSNS
jgi:hypothetical protein